MYPFRKRFSHRATTPQQIEVAIINTSHGSGVLAVVDASFAAAIKYGMWCLASHVAREFRKGSISNLHEDKEVLFGIPHGAGTLKRYIFERCQQVGRG